MSRLNAEHLSFSPDGMVMPDPDPTGIQPPYPKLPRGLAQDLFHAILRDSQGIKEMLYEQYLDDCNTQGKPAAARRLREQIKACRDTCNPALGTFEQSFTRKPNPTKHGIEGLRRLRASIELTPAREQYLREKEQELLAKLHQANT